MKVFASYAPTADAVRNEWQGAAERFDARGSGVKLTIVRSPIPWRSIALALSMIALAVFFAAV